TDASLSTPPGCCSGGLVGNRLDACELFLEPVLCIPKVATVLHSQQQIGRAATEAGETQCHLGGDTTLTGEHRVKRGSTEAHAARCISNRDLQMLNKRLSHQLPRVGRRPL